eukprot:TRINITY_DN4822_c0_g2_i1.p2 TRINITY_DN4822_c0_g2~~TRINITY_DN4822_c0_g2_i1.p2  ORF type:complete len:119 (+),score=1.10 TRINITY_DN4822_c0_g2_i1:35-358(+)
MLQNDILQHIFIKKKNLYFTCKLQKSFIKLLNNSNQLIAISTQLKLVKYMAVKIVFYTKFMTILLKLGILHFARGNPTKNVSILSNFGIKQRVFLALMYFYLIRIVA